MKKRLARKIIILMLAIVMCLGGIYIVASSNGEIPADSIFTETVEVNGNTVKSTLSVWDIKNISDNMVVGMSGKETQPLFFKETGSAALVETVVTRLDDSKVAYRQNEPMAGIYVTDGIHSGHIGVRANSIYYTNNTWRNGVIDYDVLSRLAKDHKTASVTIALKDNQFRIYVDYLPVQTVNLQDVVPGIEEGATVAIGLVMHAAGKNAQLQYSDVTFTTDAEKVGTFIENARCDASVYPFITYARALGKGYEEGIGSNKITVSENTTIFIGDSFFDRRGSWTDFYTKYYRDADAFLAGIGSTNTWHWNTQLINEVFAVFGDKAPKNIAIHLGTNNLWYAEEENVTIGNLKKVFETLHTKYPNTKIYYFGITHRAEEIEATTNEINNINAAISTWCGESTQEYITYIDTPSQIKAEHLKSDKLHPLLESYYIFAEALQDAGCEMLDKNGQPFTLSYSK